MDCYHSSTYETLLKNAGVQVAEIDDRAELAEGSGSVRHAQQQALSGARMDAKIRRQNLVQAHVKRLAICESGRLFAAVTGEGFLVYSTL